MLSDLRKIGLGLLGLGVFFLLLGMLLLFDRKLLAMGNILFLVGFTLLSTPRRTAEFFGLYGDRVRDRWQKRWRGLVTFFGGIYIVMAGYPVVGMLVELFGFVNLFGSFFPLVLAFLRSLPVVGPVLNMPVISTVADKLSGKPSQSMV
mmetsp:Transcript_450/g.1078  ORF Transcript_450/g.1078 Transcript_450/m.1078 type:complete len:148 (-) Transcript_450:1009-1452(-)